MLTFEDCLALCALSEEEIEAIREHEHVPEIVALEMGDYLAHAADGTPRIKRIILDDIRVAERRGDVVHVARLKLTLRRFIEAHPGFPA